MMTPQNTERPWIAGDRIWRGWDNYSLLIVDVDGDRVTIQPPPGFSGVLHESINQLRQAGWKSYSPQKFAR